MSTQPPSEPLFIRRVVDAWAAEQAGMLGAEQRLALDSEQPDWRSQATRLIAEGLLAYVAVEMVVPDLAIAASSGQHRADDDALAARLGAHLRDFVDYRGELQALSELQAQIPAPACGAHEHETHPDRAIITDRPADRPNTA
jgi:hypothetical protein